MRCWTHPKLLLLPLIFVLLACVRSTDAVGTSSHRVPPCLEREEEVEVGVMLCDVVCCACVRDGLCACAWVGAFRMHVLMCMSCVCVPVSLYSHLRRATSLAYLLIWSVYILGSVSSVSSVSPLRLKTCVTSLSSCFSVCGSSGQVFTIDKDTAAGSLAQYSTCDVWLGAIFISDSVCGSTSPLKDTAYTAFTQAFANLVEIEDYLRVRLPCWFLCFFFGCFFVSGCFA